MAGDWEDVRRQAHTLKGLAASLGATELQPRAAALEFAAQAHDIVGTRNNLATTLECLVPLLSALRLHYGMEDPVVAAPYGERRETRDVEQPSMAARVEFADWLRRFRSLLQQADVEAKELWRSRPAEIDAQLPLNVVHRISLALENFEFDAALRLLPENPKVQDARLDKRAPNSS